MKQRLTLEQLNMPRYLVKPFAFMADRGFYSGQIITLTELDEKTKQWFMICGGGDRLYDAFFDMYPNCFTKKEWWEDREESELPQYVKLVINEKIQFVHKVEKWLELNALGSRCFEYKNKAGTIMSASVDILSPATEAEYIDLNEAPSTRKKALQWWEALASVVKNAYFKEYKEDNFTPASNEKELTGREVEKIYTKWH